MPKKTKRLCIRLEESQKLALEDMADRKGLSVGAFVRAVVDKRIRYDTKELLCNCPVDCSP